MKKRILIISYNKLDIGSKLPGILEKQPNIIKILDTTWLISTTDTSKQFFTKIEPYLDKDNERIFITEIAPEERQGWLSRSIWDWLTNQK